MKGELPDIPVSAVKEIEVGTPLPVGVIEIVVLVSLFQAATCKCKYFVPEGTSKDTGQLVWQLAIAEPESTNPMAMTIGPVTTGGK